MMLSAFLLTLALAQAPQEPAPAAASPTPAAETTAAPAEAPKAEGAAEAPKEGAEAKAEGHGEAAKEAEGHGKEGEGEHEEGASAILMHHVTNQAEYHPFGLPFPFSKHLFFLVAAMLLVIVAARLALASYKDGAPRGIGSAVESLVIFVRDEIAIRNIGHDGAKYTSLLLSFFFFILFAALFGLVPFSATATGNISVTMALALVSFAAQMYAGISKYGIGGHLKNLIPHGLPAPLLIVIIPIEVMSMFTKPFALMVRLFANMLAGHMMITALLMLVPLCAVVSQGLGIMMFPVSIGMALFISCLEILVAFIQAYIFTLFSAIFIGMYAHPAH
jgi:F-type H+-transporting ATPase subunit a